MDIFVKSFNRPFYLDKCLYSIEKYVTSKNCKLIILDDGTPEKYLQKIKQKYPYAIIEKSNFYLIKSYQIENNLDTEKLIPIDFWIEKIKNSSDNFILLEEDMWFTNPINLDQIEEELNYNNIQLAKLFWLNNSNLIPKEFDFKTNDITIYNAKLFTLNKIILI